MSRTGIRLGALAAVAALAFGACGSSTASPSPSPVPIFTPLVTPTSAIPSSGITLRWFVGMEMGSSDAQVAAERAFVTSYNTFNKDGITIKLEIVPTDSAAAILRSEIDSGNAPDIVGPLGIGDYSGFKGVYADLTSLIDSFKVDKSVYGDGLVSYLNLDGQGQLGLPYMIFPGYLWYNRDIFTKAGLPALPTQVDEPYQGEAWTWDALAELGRKLTIDKSGRPSTDAKFDAKSIVRYGFDFQWTDLRRLASCFGGGSLVAADGTTSQIPAAWAEGLTWYYSGMWGANPFIPNTLALESDLLDGGNSQASGVVAMNVAWTTMIPSIATDSKTTSVKTWDMAVLPSWNGYTSSPMYMDTFSITRASKNPEAAFKVILALMADNTLLKAYGGEPARTVDQQAYFAAFDQVLNPIFPQNQVTWSVLTEMQKHPATPSFEAELPNSAKSSADIAALLVRLQSTAGLDVIAELTRLQSTLQADFSASK
jgi:multiple sugar transport system substrate-binding protein